MKIEYKISTKPIIHPDGVFVNIYAYHEEVGVGKEYEIGPIDESKMDQMVLSISGATVLSKDEQFDLFRKICDFEYGMKISYFTIWKWENGAKYRIEVNTSKEDE